MKLSTFARSIALAGLLSDVAAHAQTKPALQVAYDANGLSSVRYGGTEMLHSAVIGLSELDLRKAFPPKVDHAAAVKPTSSFDAAKHVLAQTYPWGSLTCGYSVDGDRLMLDFTVHNTSKDSIFGLTAEPLQLQLGGPAKIKSSIRGWPTPSVATDVPEIVDVAAAGGTVAFCDEQVDRPLWLDVDPVHGPKTSNVYGLSVRHDGPPRGEEISAGDSREFFLSVRFGPVGSTSLQLAKDLYEKFGKRYPSEMHWTDRRPIGCNFCSSMDDRSATNPSGWLDDKTVDMTTDAGRADWKKRMLARFDKSASVAKEMGCQGVIVWDIEGQRNPQPISYIGDPRLMPVLSPEMDPIADELFKKYTDAGLRRGVTVRPTHVVRTFGGEEAWEHVNAEDIAAEIAGKIAYAKKRWGCTLFYIDSTVRWDLSAEGEFSLHTIPAEIFQTVHRQFPDVLLIPEESAVRHFAYTAPYHEVMPPQNYMGTSAEVKAIYPDAFSMIRVADAPVIRQDADALVNALRGGDIIMFRTWLDDPDNVPVKQILARAAEAGR